MSTKTIFKRIALVSVASLGLGLLSVVPSQAAFTSGPTITVGAGTATKALSDSTNAATVTVAWTQTASSDSIVVVAYPTAVPATATTPVGRFGFSDTSGALVATVANLAPGASLMVWGTATDSVAASTGVILAGAAGYNVATLYLFNESSTARVAGTYTYAVTATPHSSVIDSPTAGTYKTAEVTSKVVSANVNITVAALASESKTSAAGTSFANLVQGSSYGNATVAGSDSTVVVSATASATARGVIRVALRNAAGGNSQESITATISAGLIGTSAVQGRSVTLAYDGTDLAAGYKDLKIYSDGTAATDAVITIKTPSVTFTNKKVSFYGAATKLVVTPLNSVLGVGSSTACLLVTATDASGIQSAATLYAFSGTSTVIAAASGVDYAASCAYDATYGGQVCNLTGAANGTSAITIRNATTVAAATVASDPVTVTVNGNTAASVKLKFDKATYAPGEKAYIILTAYDVDGKVVPVSSGSYLSSAGITSNVAFTNNGVDASTDLVSRYNAIVTAQRNATAPLSLDPVAVWTVYMPLQGGTVTISAKGGTALPVGGQIALTASATVTDTAASALAAVTALASQVSAFITKINAQITTLTDLVMKIQKKVKA